MRIGLAEIEAAQRRIAGAILRTPLSTSTELSARCGAPVLLKCEHRQPTGSFKLRGATNAVLSLTDDERAAGVVAVSTGNHGRALANAAATAGARCVIAMSRLVPRNKVDAIRAEGAEILIEGRSQDEAEKEAARLASEGMTMVPPFDDPCVIAGQGTLGLEIAEEAPEAETVLVPLSGGGLLAGVAAAMKARRPGVRVIGVSMARGAAMAASLEAGRPVEVEEMASLADSLGGGVGLSNRHTFKMVRDLVDEVVLLSEADIAAGIRHCFVEEGEVVEGAGAVGVAALIAGRARAKGPTVAILTGGNIDPALHARIVAGETPDLAGETA